MSDVRTAAFTIIGGIIIFVISEFLQKFVLEPLLAQRKLIAEISHSLIYYANIYSNPGTGKPEDIAEASKSFRNLASALRVSAYTTPCYLLAKVLHRAPSSTAMLKASRELIGLSNAVGPSERVTGPEHASAIRALLRISAE